MVIVWSNKWGEKKLKIAHHNFLDPKETFVQPTLKEKQQIFTFQKLEPANVWLFWWNITEKIYRLKTVGEELSLTRLILAPLLLNEQRRQVLAFNIHHILLLFRPGISRKATSTNSRAAPPLVHRADRQVGWGKWGQECALVFQAPNYKGECALSSRPPDEEEDRPNQALSL